MGEQVRGWMLLVAFAVGCVSPAPGGGGSGLSTGSATTDPFLSGDSTSLSGIYSLWWDSFAGEGWETTWFATAWTFWPGTFGWTGELLVPATGFDTCQIRAGDPEYSYAAASAGAVDFYAGPDHVATSSSDQGGYDARTDISALDPRGRSFEIVAQGDDLPPFDAPDAVTYPTGSLEVTVTSASTSAALGFTWKGPAADRVEIRLSSDGMDVRCLVVDDGAFEVPADAMGWLPPGPLTYQVIRTNAVGVPIDADQWVQVIAQQAALGTLDLTP